MYKVVSLVLLFSVLLIGVSFTQNSYAANHPFELDWGMSGIEKPGMFLNPQHLAVDSEDNIYVTDLGNSRVQKFDEQGTYVRSWGSQGSGPGEFSHPSGIAVIDDYVFIVDRALDTVQKFDNLGNFVMQWGGFGSGNGEFRSPNGIAISDDKFVYVVDTGNNRIQKFTLDGEYVSGFGQSGKRAGNFISPIDIAVDSEGKLFVTDPGNNRINVYNDDGKFLRTLDSSVGGFKISPRGIVVDESDNIYIGDQRNNRIIQFNQYGFSLSIFGVTGNSEGQFQSPKDVTVDNNGFLYVTDTLNHRIQKFSTPIVLEKLIIGQEIVKEPTVEQQEQLSEPEYIIEEQIELPLVNPVPNDFTKPLISVPSDVIIEATGALTPVNVGNAMASDESGILSLSNNASEEFPIGITTIIWTAIDGAGNMAIESQNIIVQDTIPPEIEQLKEIRLEAKSETENLVQLKTPTISDVVGVISIESDAPAVFPLGETTVTWTATDVMRNVSTMQQKVVLIDSTSPRVDIPEDIIVEATSINDNSISLIEPEVFDHVKVESLSNDAPQSFPLGETIVTWMVADSSGNVSTSSHKVIVVDTTSPEIFINNVTLEGMISSGSELLLPTPQINDIDEVIVTNNAPTIFPFGETIVTWTATDQSGNVATKEQSVNVVDTIRPLLVIPDDIEVEANGINTIIDDLGELTVNDISDIAYTTNDAPEKFPLGETIVTWAVSDIAGNSVSGTQLVTVVDTTSPEIIAPSDIKLEAVDLTENYIELVDGRVFDTVEIKSVENNSPETFPLGETIVTWTATDTSGNSVSDTQTITIEDTTQPVITGPDNITLEIIDSSGMVVDVGQASALDQVDTNPEITNDAPELFQLGDTIVTWTATDSSGNSSLFFQTITVVDTEEPELIPPENIIQEAENPLNNFVILGIVETSDIVGVSSITNNAPETFPLGETIVTWTASDNAGNSVSGTQLVTVVDTTSPEIIAPSDIKLEAVDLTENYIELVDGRVFDTVEIKSVENNSPETFPLGETIVTWTATDTSGNSVSDTQTITIEDTTQPVITGPDNITLEIIDSSGMVVDVGQASALDQVDTNPEITNDAPELFQLGDTIVTWTATDSSGNSSLFFQTITVVDTEEPELIPPENIIQEAENPLNNFVILGIVETSDIVGVSSITNNAPETFPLGETIVTWTASDNAGNSVSETQLINVQICGNSPSYYNMILGTAEDNFLSGTSLPDLIFGYGGDDIIMGNNGNDCIFAGEGNDIIFGNGGDDNISGDQGNDMLKGDSGEDILKGGVGLDMIDGGDDIDTCIVVEEQNSDLVVKCETNE